MPPTSHRALPRHWWTSPSDYLRIWDKPGRPYVVLRLESLESLLAPNLFSLVGSLLPGLTALGSAGVTALEDYAANAVSVDYSPAFADASAGAAPSAVDAPEFVAAATAADVGQAVGDDGTSTAIAPPPAATANSASQLAGDQLFADPTHLTDLNAPLPDHFALDNGLSDDTTGALAGWLAGAGTTEQLSTPPAAAVEPFANAAVPATVPPASVPAAAASTFIPLAAASTTPQPAPTPVDPGAAMQALAQQGLRFETNEGQIDGSYNFVAHASTFDLALNASNATLALKSPTGGAPTMLNMEIVGSNPTATVQGQQVLPGVTNYLGGPGATFTGVVSYADAAFHNVYNGIDVVYHTAPGASQLEYDFIVAPNADAGQVALAFQGADYIGLDAGGDLVLHTGAGDVVQQAPVAYQTIDGVRHDVATNFTLNADGQVGFALGAYDHSQALTIDPTYTYASYLGGANADTANAVAVNPVAAMGAERVFVVGSTSSATFRPNDGNGAQPIQPTLLNAGGQLLNNFANADGQPPNNLANAGGQPPNNFANAAYAICIDPTNNNAPIYLDYIGGSSAQVATAVAVDASNNAYITGYTTSFQGFPVTAGAMGTNAAQQAAHGGQPANPNLDAFAVFLDPKGNQTYGTYLGGQGDDAGYGIALDNNGNVYIAGITYSAAFANKAVDAVFGGLVAGQSQDAFVAQLSGKGVLTSLVYVGGSGSDQINAITTGPGGHVYLAGTTTSTDLLQGVKPTMASFQTVLAPAAGGGTASDAFVADLVYNPKQAGVPTVNYETYFGGDGSDQGLGIALDPVAGDVYLVGSTTSSAGPQGAGWGGGGANPVLIQPTVLGTTGGTDAYVAKFDINGNPNGAKPYFAYLAGTATDIATSVALVPQANATPLLYVAGTTGSADNAAGGFPATQGGAKLQNFNLGNNNTSTDVFLASLNPFAMNPAASIVALSYIGGSNNDTGSGVAYDPWAGNVGNAWVSGTTSSNDLRPANVAGLQATAGGGQDGFVVSVKP